MASTLYATQFPLVVLLIIPLHLALNLKILPIIASLVPSQSRDRIASNHPTRPFNAIDSILPSSSIFSAGCWVRHGQAGYDA
jgi:hypothetical protein